eukprot:scaffold68539_cov85-Phaeocystis_antarctica.AAC.1
MHRTRRKHLIVFWWRAEACTICHRERAGNQKDVCHREKSLAGGAAHIGAAHEIERRRQPPLVLQYIVDDALAGGGRQQ